MYKLNDLEVYKQARIYRIEVAAVIKTFPKNEQFSLSDQLKRSSRAVAANIAEGYGRFHFQENIQFCRQARGSLFESYEHITAAFDEGYISKEVYDENKSRSEHLLKLLNGYISYLRQQKSIKTT